MNKYLIAQVIDAEELKIGVVLDEFFITRNLKTLDEQTKLELVGAFLQTRTDKFMVLFSNGSISFFKPDQVKVSWIDEEEYVSA